ncbi:hypothetical protein QTN47_12595 [Danxiaibacter flavus]|uniref:Uncharacterized protein n=1 Tax=Danxiaibacter flavus TaxID=3049108 RepID=A0ABV3ZEN7_9BACT|nr:hypothetical protein QNM32_12600 [Chitinophagaceae bacterium DXS]
MKIKISVALIGLACIALITTVVKLGSLTGTEITVILATICVSLIGGFHLLDENGDTKGPTN